MAWCGAVNNVVRCGGVLFHWLTLLVAVSLLVHVAVNIRMCKVLDNTECTVVQMN